MVQGMGTALAPPHVLDIEEAVERPPSGPPARRVGRRWSSPSPDQLATVAIALIAAGLYTWGLSRVGWGNSYYAAAVKSATRSWKAFFFGSIDPGSFITVDK